MKLLKKVKAQLLGGHFWLATVKKELATAICSVPLVFIVHCHQQTDVTNSLNHDQTTL
ncbi:hypothetical protein RchiOBHm_Chr4g0427581 [Rosa chinensis]|uniref:Uncharacterized protein n=1 Tax=Rosa chinensis TaxID=74649 RepID=A0A2P6QZP2_ROSCH|nr:hypothetical protein RchiOBHm_Chr4g0427581 [Rosa chinensis]